MSLWLLIPFIFNLHLLKYKIVIHMFSLAVWTTSFNTAVENSKGSLISCLDVQENFLFFLLLKQNTHGNTY
jgi:hypothetical protein